MTTERHSAWVIPPNNLCPPPSKSIKGLLVLTTYQCVISVVAALLRRYINILGLRSSGRRRSAIKGRLSVQSVTALLSLDVGRGMGAPFLGVFPPPLQPQEQLTLVVFSHLHRSVLHVCRRQSLSPPKSTPINVSCTSALTALSSDNALFFFSPLL